MLRIYFNSKQLGIKTRLIAMCTGFIPIVNIIVLGMMIKIVADEVKLENNKIILNEQRKYAQICSTRYPILMVHGVFFRDFKAFNYWGRVTAELEANGARLFYGNHQSAASVYNCGQELAARVMEIINTTGCDKLNIIDHSKGGLDSRSMVYNNPEVAKHIASITTINTPHRGCEFADYLLNNVPEGMKNGIANTYNAALRKIGDQNPSFLDAVWDLTKQNCDEFNAKTPDVPGIYYQSVGSKLNVSRGGRFPLNFTEKLVNFFSGANDGLVDENSFPWGSHYRMLTVQGNRGISHGDMIDLNRENLPELMLENFTYNW